MPGICVVDTKLGLKVLSSRQTLPDMVDQSRVGVYLLKETYKPNPQVASQACKIVRRCLEERGVLEGRIEENKVLTYYKNRAKKLSTLDYIIL